MKTRENVENGEHLNPNRNESTMQKQHTCVTRTVTAISGHAELSLTARDSKTTYERWRNALHSAGPSLRSFASAVSAFGPDFTSFQLNASPFGRVGVRFAAPIGPFFPRIDRLYTYISIRCTSTLKLKKNENMVGHATHESIIRSHINPHPPCQ